LGRILVIVVAFVATFATYFAYIWLARRKQALSAAGQLPPWQALPWTWLIVASVLLMVVLFVLMRIFDIDPDDWIGGESLVGR